MRRFNSLLLIAGCYFGSLLDGFLCFDSKVVKIHIISLTKQQPFGKNGCLPDLMSGYFILN
jgi:hypothetical protein